MQNDFYKTFEKFINPIGYRDGMVINSPFSHLGSEKKLMMVGHNPGGVSQESNTSIKEDWSRHMADPSFNALKEDWDGKEGTHPIQLLNTTLIENTSLNQNDILSTNVYWKRSKNSEQLNVDAILEKNCKDGFLYNLEVHQPDCILFLGHASADIATRWACRSTSLKRPTPFPWGNDQLIKYKKLSFNKIGVFNTVSIPHPSRFRIGENQDRVISILEALDRNGIS